MKKTYVRLVELFVKSDLRDEIKQLKQGQTYDEYLRNLIRKNDSLSRRTKPQTAKKGEIP